MEKDNLFKSRLERWVDKESEKREQVYLMVSEGGAGDCSVHWASTPLSGDNTSFHH